MPVLMYERLDKAYSCDIELALVYPDSYYISSYTIKNLQAIISNCDAAHHNIVKSALEHGKSALQIILNCKFVKSNMDSFQGVFTV